MGLENKVDIRDTVGDGNCGYYSLLYGLHDNRVPIGREILQNSEPHLELRRRMFEHAQKPEVIKDILQNEVCQTLFDLTPDQVDEPNFVPRLKEAIAHAPVEREKIVNDIGIEGLGFVIAGMDPEKVRIRNENDVDRVRENHHLHFDTTFGAAVAAHLSKTRVVVYNVSQAANTEEAAKRGRHALNKTQARKKYTEVTVVDARQDHVSLEITGEKGYLPENDPLDQTIYMCGDGQHFMYVKPLTEEEMALKPAAPPRRGRRTRRRR